MLVNTAEGRSYAPQEIKGWLVETGFRGITVKRLGETMVLSGKRISATMTLRHKES
jgi:hypothetical protein